MAPRSSFNLHLSCCWTLGSSGSCWGPGLLERSMELDVLGWYTVWSLLSLVSIAVLWSYPSCSAWPPACALCPSLMFPAFYTCFAHTYSGIPQTVNVCRGDGEVQVPHAGRLCCSCGLVSGKQIPSLVGTHFIFPFFPSCLWTGSGILDPFLQIF